MRLTILLLALAAAGCAGPIRRQPNPPPFVFEGLITGADTVPLDLPADPGP